MKVGRGRRPGGVDTRAEIVHAARAVFAEQGYAEVSMRAIARRAGVDPALIHHYFADKAALFVETMGLPFDPREIKDEVSAEGFSGELLVERFLAQWEQAGGIRVTDLRQPCPGHGSLAGGGGEHAAVRRRARRTARRAG